MSESDPGTVSNSSASKDYVGPNTDIADSRKPLGTEIPPTITTASIGQIQVADSNSRIIDLLSSTLENSQTQQNLLTREIYENKALRFGFRLLNVKLNFLREEISNLKLQIAEQQANIDRNQDIRSDQAFKIEDLQQSNKELKDKVEGLESENSKLLEEIANLRKSLVEAKKHVEAQVLTTGELKTVASVYLNDRKKQWLAKK